MKTPMDVLPKVMENFFIIMEFTFTHSLVVPRLESMVDFSF